MEAIVYIDIPVLINFHIRKLCDKTRTWSVTWNVFIVKNNASLGLTDLDSVFENIKNSTRALGTLGAKLSISAIHWSWRAVCSPCRDYLVFCGVIVDYESRTSPSLKYVRK